MAITRRDMVKLGVSFGSGTIAFKNDELAYVEALRAFPDDDRYDAFKAALAAENIEQAREALTDLRSYLAHLSMSELYLQARELLEALQEDALPPIAELEDFDAAYLRLKEYCATH